jgi:nucleotide-binding universal stress UspA family protein
MTKQESHRATVEARRAAGSSQAPISSLEKAMHQYLAATEYESVSPKATQRHYSQPDSDSVIEGSSTAVAPTPFTDLVVAGLDGSACARNAARWAADEATRRNTGLHLVHAYHLPPAGVSGYNPYPPHLLADLRDEGADLLAQTAGELQRDFPQLVITTALIYGDPGTVLRHASGGASMTVVGIHGTNRVAVALGSVAAEVARTSPVPVAVIHPNRISTTGPIVVGVDGSPVGRAAIQFAFETAAAREASLIAVHCWTGPSVDGPIPAYSAGLVDPKLIQDGERALLGQELAEWTTKYPTVGVQQAVIHDGPAVGLLQYAPFAQLIVAGSRGHSGITGLLLGSTGQALIARSTCPVVIIRPTPAR